MTLLSICIPTYNRLPYLKELMPGLVSQVSEQDEVELCVSDNASTDGTKDYVESVACNGLRFWTNEVNIGGDRNFLKCIREARGEYVWLVGDDDLVPDGAVERVVGILRNKSPSLVISVDSDVAGGEYADYRAYLDVSCSRSSRLALSHSLISANVFRRTAFDMTFAEKKLYTQYSHMFGMVGHLEGCVVLVPGLIGTRPVRAAFASYPSFLCVKQALYLAYLARRFRLLRFYWYALANAANLPLEFASRIKNAFVNSVRHLRMHSRNL